MTVTIEKLTEYGWFQYPGDDQSLYRLYMHTDRGAEANLAAATMAEPEYPRVWKPRALLGSNGTAGSRRTRVLVCNGIDSRFTSANGTFQLDGTVYSVISVRAEKRIIRKPPGGVIP